MDSDEIKSLAGKYKTFPETIQKDYSATVLLSLISKFDQISEMAFKGGTCIKKIYFPETRFSEDLDFTCTSDISSELELFLKKKIKDLDVNFAEVKKVATIKHTHKYRVKYLNYNDYPMSVGIDLSMREKIIKNVKTLPIRHFYNLENTHFSIPSMDIGEILAEKIRALTHSKKPRHLYDLWYLFEHNVKLEKNLVNSKLSLYGEEFSMDKTKSTIQNMKSDWQVDLNLLLPTVPTFYDVSESVIHNIETAMRS